MPRSAMMFRDGDIVEVKAGPRGCYVGRGVVDTRLCKPGVHHSRVEALFKFVWVRKLDGEISTGGWWPSQCRLLERPAPEILPVPDNVILGGS